MTEVRVVGVSCKFGDLAAVDDVSFEVAGGEVVGLVGANGAGKTTMIRMILGLLTPDQGEIRVLDLEPRHVDRSDIGYVPQGLGLYRDLTVAENVSFSTRAFDAPSADLDPELEGLADRPVGEISRGLQRRLAFATVLNHSPKVLMLDEPTSGVGPLGRIRLWDQIRSEAERGAAVLVSTHYMEEAEQCDRVLLMAEGRLVANGTIVEIIGSRTTPVVLGVGPDVIAATGMTAIPDGDAWRFPGGDPGDLRKILGPTAIIRDAPMVFEETFLGTS